MGTVFFAVLSGAIVYLLLGMLWYGKLFGEAWMQLVGMTKKDIKKARKKGMGTSYAMASLSALVMSYVLYTFMQLVGAGSMLAGINVGLLMWFGFIGTTQLSGVLWENRPVRLYYVNAGYFLVALMLMGAVISWWL
jgi:hypothetical protein